LCLMVVEDLVCNGLTLLLLDEAARHGQAGHGKKEEDPRATPSPSVT
jgi:hypothetical protein